MTDTDEHLPAPGDFEKVTTADHFLPQWDDWGGELLRSRVYEMVNVPIEPAISDAHYGTDGEAIFDFMRTEWLHFDCEGPLTRARFIEGRDGAVRHFADQINALGVFKPVRLFTKPPVSLGVAYYDFEGEEMPFDLRCVADFGVFRFPEKPEECDHGLRFQIATLVQKGYGCAVDFNDLTTGKVGEWKQ